MCLQPLQAKDRMSISNYYGPCVRVLHQGDSFGERALDTLEPRNATVITQEPTDLLVLGRKARGGINIPFFSPVFGLYTDKKIPYVAYIRG